MTKKISLDPGELKDSKGYVLSKEEWLGIQTYVNNALHLPVTDSQMRVRLGLAKDADVVVFEDIIKVYGECCTHALHWRDEVYPDSVNLSSDVVHYARKAKTYYGALSKIIEKLIDSPDDERAKKTFTAILDNLSKQAREYEDRARKVSDKIKKFSDDLANDKSKLADLKPEYDKKFGDVGKEGKSLKEELETQEKVLKAANEAYQYSVVRAATTPTYAWVFPLGTIAATVVAGVYGKQATDALEKAKVAQKKIDSFKEKIRRNINITCSLGRALKDLSSIREEIAPALKAVQKVQGVWSAIASDLTDIRSTNIDDIRNNDALLKNLAVDDAIDAWKDVGERADSYRQNAYVTVVSDDDVGLAEHVVIEEAVIEMSSAA